MQCRFKKSKRRYWCLAAVVGVFTNNSNPRVLDFTTSIVLFHNQLLVLEIYDSENCMLIPTTASNCFRLFNNDGLTAIANIYRPFRAGTLYFIMLLIFHVFD